MGDINQVLGAEGGGHVVTAGGSEYRLAAITKQVQGYYESWLEGAVRDQAIRAVERATGAERPRLQQYLRNVNVEIAAGLYGWQTEAWEASMRTTAGIGQLLFLLLRRHHPELTAADARQLLEDFPTECGQALNAALEASGDGGGPADPNAQRPPATTA